jgi:hypothetical protein
MTEDMQTKATTAFDAAPESARRLAGIWALGFNQDLGDLMDQLPSAAEAGMTQAAHDEAVRWLMAHYSMPEVYAHSFEAVLLEVADWRTAQGQLKDFLRLDAGLRARLLASARL